MTRVLILTASYGSGHNAAARSLADAFERAGTTVTVVDHFRELVHPVFDRLSRTLYHGLLRRAPFLWGLSYSFADWMAVSHARGGLALGLWQTSLAWTFLICALVAYLAVSRTDVSQNPA